MEQGDQRCRMEQGDQRWRMKRKNMPQGDKNEGRSQTKTFYQASASIHSHERQSSIDREKKVDVENEKE